MSSFYDMIQGNIPVLVDFSAEWCGPCKMMPPILKQVKDQLGEKIKIIKIDVDKNQVLSQKYQIRNVPTLIIFKNGEQKFRQAGVIQAPQLLQLVQPYI